MKKLIFISLIALFACKQKVPEFKSLSKKTSFRYEQFGDGEETAKQGETLSLSLLFTKEKDTLHYVPNYPYFIEVGSGPIDSLWHLLKVGDSITFRLPRSMVNQHFRFYQLLQSDAGMVDMHVRLHEKYADKKEADLAQKMALSKRELEEQSALRSYLKNLKDSLESYDGIYRKVGGEPSGDSIQYGSEVSIQYKGSFLNGYIFDNTANKKVTPTFVYGKEYQMIEGMQLALKGLREGESVKIILPSRRAFGGEGSLAGIVPPYTAVIFEVEILKVTN
jgi:FKBP-type peptidyl-prolyl cis-trans isomerase